MNMKQRQRDALTKERQHRLLTGGGPSTSDAEIDPDVSQITPGLLVEVQHVYDSDATFETAAVVPVEDDSQPNIVYAIPSTSHAVTPPPFTFTPPPLPTVPVAPTYATPTTPSVPATSGGPPSRPTPHPIPPPPPPPFQRHKNTIIEKEYQDRRRRANELHELEVQILKEKLREAKAKADTAEILRQQQQDAPGEMN